jgi:hypothetical protein
MWLGILTCIVAAAAVVTQIGELIDVGYRKGLVPGDSWEHRAIALAVTAGVADLDLSARVIDQFI